MIVFLFLLISLANGKETKGKEIGKFTDEVCYGRIHNYTSKCEEQCDGIENLVFEKSKVDATHGFFDRRRFSMKECSQCFEKVIPEKCRENNLLPRPITEQVMNLLN